MALNAAARRFKKETDRIGAEGAKRIEEHKSEIDCLPVGSWVCIDIVTGEYVVANELELASDEFKKKFGEERLAYIHGVGVEVHA